MELDKQELYLLLVAVDFFKQELDEGEELHLRGEPADPAEIEAMSKRLIAELEMK